MSKKRWQIKGIEYKDYSVSRCGAYLDFDDIKESNYKWDFYLDKHHTGTLYKSMNRIVNLQEFREKTK